MKEDLEAAIKLMLERIQNETVKPLEKMQLSQAVLNLVNARHSFNAAN